jgi:hypothetical protein
MSDDDMFCSGSIQTLTMETRHLVLYVCVILKRSNYSEFFLAHMSFMQNVLISGLR